MNRTTARILDTRGNIITDGLQAADTSDEAIRAAYNIADDRSEDVILVDSDGWWRVTPAGGAEPLSGADKAALGFNEDE